MFKNVEKSKILLSFVAIALIFVLLGSVYSFATENNSGNTVTITATTDNATSNNTSNTNATNNTGNTNKTTNITSVVQNNTSNNTANNTNNTSVYNNANSTTNSTNLPYTGTSSKTIAFVVIFAISAVYAYKKVSDYNV